MERNLTRKITEQSLTHLTDKFSMLISQDEGKGKGKVQCMYPMQKSGL